MESYVGAKAALSNGGKIINNYVTLNTGARMPIIGFGTFRIRGTVLIYTVLDAALQAGYRSFDSAAVYGNEQDIGVALKKLLPKYGLKREDIFITTKLSPSDHGEKAAAEAVKKSLKHLDTPYLDLFLIHWPGVSGEDVSSSKNLKLRAESWNMLVKLHDNGQGVLRAIGVSNYTAKHMSELLGYSKVAPAVNQVEFHPHYQQPPELYEVCRKSGTLLQAYSSLGSSRPNSLLTSPEVTAIAHKYNVSTAQVLLRFGLQCGYGIIPKSVTPVRILENAQLDFSLAEADMEKLLNIQHREKYAWEPSTVL